MELMYWWLPLLVLVAVNGVVLWHRKQESSQSASPQTIANTQRLRRLPAYQRALRRAVRMRVLAVLCLVIAGVGATLAASRWVYTEVNQPQSFNRDIVLCLDVSGSMIEYDAEVIDRYLEMLPGFNGERMSLVVWNSSAVPIFPLTDDYAFVEEQLKQARDAMLDRDVYSFAAGTLNKSGASLVGDGLTSCLLQFDAVKERKATPTATDQAENVRSQSVILATDNVVNGSPTVSFEEAVDLAAEYDIKVYGLDANTFDDAFQQEYEGLMGRHSFGYFRLTDDESVDAIVDSITSEQASVWRGSPQVTVVDTPTIWLLIALGGVAGLLFVQWRNRT